MGNQDSAASYEEVRRQRLLDNKQRIEELGLLKLVKGLKDDAKPEKKPQQRVFKPKRTDVYLIEPRRSSRARNPVPSYRDDVGVEPTMTFRKRSKFSSSSESYLAVPPEEVRTATLSQKVKAYKSAEKLHTNLQSDNPYFVKSMRRSHVYSCFWLGLPAAFCEDHLPKSTGQTDMMLEDEEGSEYPAVYISTRTGLSGGWRAFALEHKLHDGDALVFELIKPLRFKVYIVRAFHDEQQNEDDGESVEEVVSEAEDTQKEVANGRKKRKKVEKKSSKSKKKSVDEVVSEAEDTQEEVANGRKKRKKVEPKKPSKSKKEKSEVSGVRRSLRNTSKA